MLVFSIDGHEHLKNEVGVINPLTHTYSGSVWGYIGTRVSEVVGSNPTPPHTVVDSSVWESVGSRVLVYVGTGCVICQFNSDCRHFAR